MKLSRASSAVVWLSIAPALTTGTPVNQTTAAGLPNCVRSCFDQVLPKFRCNIGDRCFCEDTRLHDALDACSTDQCSFSDGLAQQQFLANACHFSDPDRGSLLEGVTYALFALAALLTLARILSRWSKLRGPGYGRDDLCAFLSFVFLVCMVAGDWYAIHDGEGRMTWTLTLDGVERFLRWSYICNIFYTVVIFATKMSWVLLYLRTWPGLTTSTFRSSCWITLYTLIASLFTFVLVCIFQCHPVSYIWQRVKNSDGSCINIEAWKYALAAVDIVFDFVVILLPVLKLAKLNVSFLRKTGMYCVLLVGLAVIVSSLVRLKYIHGFATEANFTYSYSYLGLWNSIEANLSQVCCCMPGVLRPTKNRCVLTGDGNEARRSFRSAAVQEDGKIIFRNRRSSEDMENVVEKKGSDDTMDMNRTLVEENDEDDLAAPAPSIPFQVHHYPRESSFDQWQYTSRPQQQSQRGIIATPAMVSHQSYPVDSRPNTRVRESSRPPSSRNGPPDILFHDRDTQVRLQINDPPEEPLMATLQYVDRESRVHDVELQAPPESRAGSAVRSLKEKRSQSPTRPGTPFSDSVRMFKEKSSVHSLTSKRSTSRITRSRGRQ